MINVYGKISRVAALKMKRKRINFICWKGKNGIIRKERKNSVNPKVAKEEKKY